MEVLNYSIAFLLSISTFIPFYKNPHWFFRMFEFAKIQLLVLQLVYICFAVIFLKLNYINSILLCATLICVVINIVILYKYSPLRKRGITKSEEIDEHSISIISANVYQYNTNYQNFISSVKQSDPDLLFTVESNKEWEEALNELEDVYTESVKIPMENTYGMHLYSKLKIKKFKVHHFVAEDIPSLEVDLIDKQGNEFSFFGVHPPPPSPTEENTSNERDGELLCIAKTIAESSKKFIVAGDFNTVAWSRSSILFRKSSDLIDARIGRGLFSTFHANYWFLRFPIDLIFHVNSIQIQQLEVLNKIGSDHLPLRCLFKLMDGKEKSQSMKENIDQQELKEVQSMIEKGRMTKSDRKSAS